MSTTSESNFTPETPKVFVSYSHDTQTHKDWVLTFAEDLYKKRIHVFLDQWDLLLGMDITGFMEGSIRRSDFVLAICTGEYTRRANGRTGGAGYEATVLSAKLLKDKKDVVIPVIPPGVDKVNVPDFLSSKLYIDFRQIDGYNEKINEIANRILGQVKPSRPIVSSTVLSTSISYETLIASAEKSREWREKRDFYRKALSLCETPEIHRKAAWCSLHMNAYGEALTHDERAVELLPDFSSSWVGIAVAGWYLGDPLLTKRAFRQVERYCSIDSAHYVEAAFYYGQSLMRLGARDEATRYLEIVANSQFDSVYFKQLKRRSLPYLGRSNRIKPSQ